MKIVAGAFAALVVAAAAAVFVVAGRGGTAVIAHGSRDRPWVALTFDADMTQAMLGRLRSGEVASYYDARIVRELRRRRVPATIFLTGLWTQAYPSVARSLARDPLFQLENHSMDHAAFAEDCFALGFAGDEAAKEREVQDAAGVIAAVTGVRTRYFRFPGGCASAGDVRLVERLDHRAVGWDVSSADAVAADPAVVVEAVLQDVRPGSIVAMHLNGSPNSPATAEALRVVIPELRRRGFRFVTLRRLLETPSDAQRRRRRRRGRRRPAPGSRPWAHCRTRARARPRPQ